MPRSTQGISFDTIEKEIYNSIEPFKQQKNIKIADLLKNLKLPVPQADSYRKIKFSYESLLKLVLFQKLKHIKFHTKLTKYLRRNPAEKFKLGFSETPDRTQIGYFINHILDQEANEAIGFTVSKINEIAEKFDVIFDYQTLKPVEPQKETQDRNQRLIRDEKTKDVCRLFKRRIAPFINLHQRHNIKYEKGELLNLLIHLGLSQDFAQNGARVFKEQRTRGPSGKTLLYHLKKYSSMAELQEMYTCIFELVWEMARQANLFGPRKRVDVAVDFTEWFFYGNRKAPMVVGKQPERGTAACYKFATISIVESGKRFTLLALPVSMLDSKESILSRLFTYATQRVKISHVYLDRGFFDAQSLRTVEKFRLTYLMPAIHNFSVKRVMDLTPSPAVVKGFTLNNLPMNLVIVDDLDLLRRPVKRVFATNMDLDEKEIGLAERLLYLYSKRWGIETSYRVKKHSFRAKTTSKNYIIRLFYFLFSVLLYNLWILADLLVWLHLHSEIGEDHLVTSKLFGTVFMLIDPGG